MLPPARRNTLLPGSESLTPAPGNEVISNNILALAMSPSWLPEKINPVLAKTRTELKLTIVTVQDSRSCSQLEKFKFCFTLSCLQTNSLKLNRIHFDEWRLLEWLIMQGWMKYDRFSLWCLALVQSFKEAFWRRRKKIGCLLFFFFTFYSFWHLQY